MQFTLSDLIMHQSNGCDLPVASPKEEGGFQPPKNELISGCNPKMFSFWAPKNKSVQMLSTLRAKRPHGPRGWLANSTDSVWIEPLAQSSNLRCGRSNREQCSALLEASKDSSDQQSFQTIRIRIRIRITICSWSESESESSSGLGCSCILRVFGLCHQP